MIANLFLARTGARVVKMYVHPCMLQSSKGQASMQEPDVRMIRVGVITYGGLFNWSGSMSQKKTIASKSFLGNF